MSKIHFKFGKFEGSELPSKKSANPAVKYYILKYAKNLCKHPNFCLCCLWRKRFYHSLFSDSPRVLMRTGGNSWSIMAHDW